MTIRTRSEPCWRLVLPTVDADAPRYCCTSREVAEGAAIRAGLLLAVAEPRPTACVTVACTACGTPSDDDEIGTDLHFPDVEQAREWAEAVGWHVVGLQALCPDCRPAEPAPHAQPWPDLFEAAP